MFYDNSNTLIIIIVHVSDICIPYNYYSGSTMSCRQSKPHACDHDHAQYVWQGQGVAMKAMKINCPCIYNIGSQASMVFIKLYPSHLALTTTMQAKGIIN